MESMSLFSRAHGKASTPKKVRGFLGLPGEIRNRIYHYYFQEDYRCEIAAKGNNFKEKKPRVMRLCVATVYAHRTMYSYKAQPEPELPTTVRISRRLGQYKRINGIQTTWLSSLCGLVLVCKQIHSEALVFLYLNTTFVSAAPQRITNFVQVLPKKNLSYVTKLHLHYSSYGDPRHAHDRVWQTKCLASWTDACKLASKKLVNLKELEIWLKANASPLQFDLRQTWLQPLLEFRRLSCVRKSPGDAYSNVESPNSTLTSPAPLQVVKVDFKTFWFKQYTLERGARPQLADASYHLHCTFAQAISRAILGASEEDAIKDFKKAWEEEYQDWHHHLGYSHTPWW